MTTLSTLKIDLGIYQENLRQTEYDLNNFEYTMTEEEFNDYLNDGYDDVEIFGLTFTPSEIIKNCDPVAYRCYKNDHESSFDVEELREYQDLEQEVTDLKEHIEYLENKIYELEMEGE